MSDDLGRLVAAIKGEDPSPDFVSSLRAELEAELDDQRSEDLADGTVVVDLDTLDAAPPTGRQTMERKWLVAGGAAAAVVLLIAVVAGIALASGDDSDNEVTAVVGIEATGLADDYFEALAAGDAEAAVGLLTPDATILQTWVNSPTGTLTPASPTPGEFLAVQTWLIAQGSEFTPAACSVSDEGAEATTVSCEWEVYNGIAQAVGAEPVPVVSTLVVTEDGIASVRRDHGPPDYDEVWDHFDEWLAITHPELLADGERQSGTGYFFDAESIEASHESGIIAAQYAAEWGAFLEANGCSYVDSPCTADVGVARAFVEALDSWDGAAAGALLADGPLVDFIATTPDELAALADWYRATGFRMDISVCQEPAGPPRTVICNYAFENAWSDALGVGPYSLRNNFKFTIEDGHVTELTSTFDTTEYSSEVWDVFYEWMLNNNSDGIAIMYDRTGPDQMPIMTPEAIELWEQYTIEFVESLAES
jgi:hypothetical protein